MTWGSAFSTPPSFPVTLPGPGERRVEGTGPPEVTEKVKVLDDPSTGSNNHCPVGTLILHRVCVPTDQDSGGWNKVLYPGPGHTPICVSRLPSGTMTPREFLLSPHVFTESYRVRVS